MTLHKDCHKNHKANLLLKAKGHHSTSHMNKFLPNKSSERDHYCKVAKTPSNSTRNFLDYSYYVSKDEHSDLFILNSFKERSNQRHWVRAGCHTFDERLQRCSEFVVCALSGCPLDNILEVAITLEHQHEKLCDVHNIMASIPVTVLTTNVMELKNSSFVKDVEKDSCVIKGMFGIFSYIRVRLRKIMHDIYFRVLKQHLPVHDISRINVCVLGPDAGSIAGLEDKRPLKVCDSIKPSEMRENSYSQSDFQKPDVQAKIYITDYSILDGSDIPVHLLPEKNLIGMTMSNPPMIRNPPPIFGHTSMDGTNSRNSLDNNMNSRIVHKPATLEAPNSTQIGSEEPRKVEAAPFNQSANSGARNSLSLLLYLSFMFAWSLALISVVY